MAKLIGTDVSIGVCRASGYPVIDPTGLVGRDGKLKKDHCVHLTISNPLQWTDDGHIAHPGTSGHELYHEDTWVCWDDLWELFLQQGDGIKDFCDWKNCPIEHEDPSPYDMLQLISTLHGYCGVE